MKKIDLHMHVMTTWNIPKIGKLNLSSPKKMIAHMEELGIGKAVLMSSGEKKIPFGKNSVCEKICNEYPEHFAWMCMLDEVDPDTIFDRLWDCKNHIKTIINLQVFFVNRKFVTDYKKFYCLYCL